MIKKKGGAADMDVWEKVTEADRERFERARRRALLSWEEKRGAIGIYAEKLLHSTLKYFYQEDAELHEVKLPHGSVADCVSDGEAIEIQTGSAYPLIKKLARYKEAGARVRVVLPIPAQKTVAWMHPETGEVSSPRKSPKTGRVYDALRELAFLRDYWGAQGVLFDLLLVDVMEYRLLNGWGGDGKRGSTRAERYPVRLAERYLLEKREDFSLFLPSSLGEPFTAEDYRRASRMTPMRAGYAVKALYDAQILDREKKGRTYFYTRKAICKEQSSLTADG